MTEHDLTRLKQTPSPRESAKREAIGASLAAFDAAKKTQPDTQALADPIRPREANSFAEGKKPMRASQFNYALAASLAALMVAAPAAFMLSRLGATVGSVTEPTALKETRADVAAAPAALAPVTTPAPVAAPTPQSTTLAAPPAKLARKAESPALGGMRGRMLGAAEGDAARSPARPEADARRADAGADRVGAGQAVATNAAPPPSAAERGFEFAYPPAAPGDGSRDKFDSQPTNDVKLVTQEPVSTFSLDVDTASYAFARRALNGGALPPADSVRVEEFINYFPYNYPKPDSAETPFRPTITVTPSPWNAHSRLVHIAVQGYALQSAQRPRANLVFLIDVSGSMQPQDRLPLVKNAFRLLLDELQGDDTVAIVTYASGSGVALAPTRVADKPTILAAIDALGAGGSTAGAQGIEDAYRLAEAHFGQNSVNRVILATDGDFNVGVTDQTALKALIERKREKGIFLSILGVGQGNYNDALMQTLAQNGNGAAAYVDNLNEARKVLVEEASSTLFPIAKDVKIQVEWNPARVSEYRLVGYETRALKREDFNNDRIDAGDVGSGHRVTAIYEITPADSDRKLVDDLRYPQQPETQRRETSSTSELGFLKLRYKLPKERASKLMTQPITDAQSVENLAKAPEDVRFSIAVAGFGQLLRGAPHIGGYSYDDVIALAQGARGDDRFGYRAEFVNLARLAKSVR